MVKEIVALITILFLGIIGGFIILFSIIGTLMLVPTNTIGMVIVIIVGLGMSKLYSIVVQKIMPYISNKLIN
ncbi:hypothetical protein [Enterococcus faecium]|nr:hypothetical protein [Enterococcus faecium]PHL10725.1 hypothetical protein CQR41_05115 [Enterococcus faecium]